MGGVSIHYEPLYGVKTASRSVASILTIDGYKILLDCGWGSTFDEAALGELPARAADVDAVLLSFPDIAHLGALPLLTVKHGLKAPVYATLPVWRLGIMFMYDAYHSISAGRTFETFNLDDVDRAFDEKTRFTLVKYQQRIELPGSPGIAVRPHPAGHMLGGAVWHVSCGTEEVLYAPNFNHRKEKHLRPMQHAAFLRPSHLIVSSARVRTPKGVIEPLVDMLRAAVVRGGNILIPVDSAGRLVELAVALLDAWQEHAALKGAQLVVLNAIAKSTFEYTRSMIEWMSDDVVKAFDVERNNLFDFNKPGRPITICVNRRELDQLRGPKVVLAATSSMHYGFARDLFVEWASNPANAVVLADVPEPGTLSAQLHEQLASRSGQRPFDITVRVERKEPLSGQDLANWREQERQRKAAEEEERRVKEEAERAAAEAAAAVDADGDVQMQPTEPAGDAAAAGADSQMPTSPASSVSLSDFDEREMQRLDSALEAAGRFSWTRRPEDVALGGEDEEQPKWDEYGQLIDTARFMIGEEPGEGAPQSAIENNVGANGMAEDAGEVEEIPTKDVVREQSVRVACAIHAIDCAGLSDGESLKHIIKQMEPRRVVIIKGTEQQTDELRKFVIETLFTYGDGEGAASNASENVVCPSVGQVSDITSNTPVQDVILRDSLVDTLNWSRVDKNAVAHVDAVLCRDADVLSLDVVKNQAAHPTLFIGSIELSQLREKLAEEGLSVYFADGVLCVENENTGAVVQVKKVSPQNIAVEGAMSEELLIARDVLYRELVVPI